MIGFLGTVIGSYRLHEHVHGGRRSGYEHPIQRHVRGHDYHRGRLIVGIPAYFGYNYLIARIEKLIFQMEANSIASWTS